MREEMEAMEKRQRKADGKTMEEEMQDRERERHGRLEVEEWWRHEDREFAQRAQQEERNFKLATMREKSLHAVFSAAVLLFCTFHLLQADRYQVSRLRALSHAHTPGNHFLTPRDQTEKKKKTAESRAPS